MKTLSVRIIVEAPPPDVVFQIQRGKSELEPPARVRSREIHFEFDLRIGRRPTGEPNFLGPFTQGPPSARFVYINSGTLAGQADSCWSRRAKVPLTAITWDLVERAIARGGTVETQMPGTGRDGGPTCASVRLPSPAWRIARPT